MGKFLDRFKEKAQKGMDRVDNMREVENKVDRKYGKFHKKEEKMGEIFDDEATDDYSGEDIDNNYDDDDFSEDVNIQQAQKPESFHHFILENQYQDLEMDIRGYKKVWDKTNQKFVTKRKDEHCFTDEEAEMIVRKAQSDLSTDIKLSRVTQDGYNRLMLSIYNQLLKFFRRIMEYQFGRFDSYEKQGRMKSQAVKIFDDLFRRISANYSRAIEGRENKDTHNSVRGQESLQSGDRDYTGRNGSYS